LTEALNGEVYFKKLFWTGISIVHLGMRRSRGKIGGKGEGVERANIINSKENEMSEQQSSYQFRSQN
jgi:hypothetical protein